MDMSEKKLDLIIEKLEGLDLKVSRIQSWMSIVDGRLDGLEQNMRKVLQCVDHENVDFFEKMKKETRKVPAKV